MRIPYYISKQSKMHLFVLCLLLVIVVGIVDYLLGEDVSIALFYLLPIALASWFVGRRSGIFMSFASAGTWVIADIMARQVYFHPFVHFWNTLMSFGFFWTVSYTLSALKASLEHLKSMARTDPLTGMINRRYFIELADKEIRRAKRFKHPFTAAYIDIDNFKEVNDRSGHDEGDKLLRSMADVMHSHIRETDIAARLGGDEFIVLLPETDHESARIFFAKMHEYLLDMVKKRRWTVTFSMGVITFVTPPVSIDDMIKHADALMYTGKHRGKDMIRFEVM
jgi:diguanylate cyclase (GGDEF)-like protein